tara:strand:+ start:969 stop:1226 length:258 start_codon:yes stop_codon:yes gene_type:complete
MITKTLNINTGKQYKVKNRQTGKTQILNAQEVANFVFKNNHKNYDIKQMPNKYENILFNIIAVLLCAVLYIALNQLFLYIDILTH